jgi:hypothetical protein
VSAHPRDATNGFRHDTPGCVVCGAPLDRAGTGRRRLYCTRACQQRAYRLRVESRSRRDGSLPADPAEVNRLLAVVLRQVGRR